MSQTKTPRPETLEMAKRIVAQKQAGLDISSAIKPKAVAPKAPPRFRVFSFQHSFNSDSVPSQDAFAEALSLKVGSSKVIMMERVASETAGNIKLFIVTEG